MASVRNVFVSGATGYMGRPLVSTLLRSRHVVRALVRPGSERKLPATCPYVLGNALDASSFAQRVPPADTFVHLVGVAHPSPAKAEQFRSIDLTALRASVTAAKLAAIRHFVYVSVAHPAPMMKSFVEVRMECEEAIRSSGLNATILRPWYVLGPGHRWPYALLPLYWIAERIPSMREDAVRLGLVRLDEMIQALVAAVEAPAQGVTVIEVPQIRSGDFAARTPERAA